MGQPKRQYRRSSDGPNGEAAAARILAKGPIQSSQYSNRLLERPGRAEPPPEDVEIEEYEPAPIVRRQRAPVADEAPPERQAGCSSLILPLICFVVFAAVGYVYAVRSSPVTTTIQEMPTAAVSRPAPFTPPQQPVRPAPAVQSAPQEAAPAAPAEPPSDEAMETLDCPNGDYVDINGSLSCGGALEPTPIQAAPAADQFWSAEDVAAFTATAEAFYDPETIATPEPAFQDAVEDHCVKGTPVATMTLVDLWCQGAEE